jgi:hypothetical protein
VQIFSTKGAKLVEIMEEQFPLEREVQRLTETNLQELFDPIPAYTICGGYGWFSHPCCNIENSRSWFFFLPVSNPLQFNLTLVPPTAIENEIAALQ